MRRVGRWTVIFRGNYFRNIKNAFVMLYRGTIFMFKVVYTIIRYLLRIILFIVGINWFEVERLIQRKIRIYFA